MPKTSDLSKLKQWLLLQRQKAIANFRAQHGSEQLLHRLSLATDQSLTRLLSITALPSDAVLVAVGGYGRQELYPHSDVDLLILLNSPPNQCDITLIERFIAALWDIGIKAASSVRTIEQCLEAANNDIATQTAQLEARYIIGNQALFTTLTTTLLDQLNTTDFFQAKHAEMRQRHARYQNTPYALEPNCKESPGALRDLQVLLWLANALGLGKTWQQISKSKLVSTAELRAIKQASQAFMRLRIELHLLTGRAEDRVLFEYQPDLAIIYGFSGKDKQQASERLMQRYYWAARVVSQMNTILMQSLEEMLYAASVATRLPIDCHFEIRNQRLHLLDAQQLHLKPQLILQCFLHVQQRPDIHSLSAQTLRALWHARRKIDQGFRDCIENQTLFLKILQQKHGVLYALQQMNMLGILPRYIPEFRFIVGQMQHDLFHIYTVDQHTLMVIRNLRCFMMAEYAEELPLASEIIDAFERPWVLYIAALFHDIAKGKGGNHAQLGAQDAREFCQRHQLDAIDTELIVFLVTDHLSMSMIAQKRDLSDPKTINDFAATLPDVRHLNALYLLTIADIKATNPTIWNSWKAKLLVQLYERSLSALQGKSQEPSVLLAQRKAEALNTLISLNISESDIFTLWSVLDTSYFLRHESDEIVWHTRTLHHAKLPATEPIIGIRPMDEDETIQLMLYTPDRDDLFMDICAFFDLHNLHTQDARIYTTKHGWALDSFVLLLPKNPHTAQTQSRRARTFPLTPTIDIQPMNEPSTWKIALTCTDRKGLLHSISKVFVAYTIRVKSAKIMTLGERAEDVFIVQSNQLQQPVFQRKVERALRAAL